MKDGNSIMPIVYALAKERQTKELSDYDKRHEVICNEAGILFTDPVYGKVGTSSSQGRRDADIISLAKERARRYVAPDQERIVARDQVNYHAIMKGSHFIQGITKHTEHVDFTVTNRNIICSFLRGVQMLPDRLIDISLHDYVGIQMNNSEWPHSILGFSKSKSDCHNLLIPDLYAMQDYKGALEKKDTLPTRDKKNKMLFIGVSSGKDTFEMNRRVAMCRYAKGKDWIESYLSGIVNFSPRASSYLTKFLHAPMTHEEQYQYRHILVIDGNTACWDRLPWVLASQCVCWKEESNDECWYYAFLKPWVHYVPFTRDTLWDTWLKVKDDIELQERLVQAGNEFVEDFLRRERHQLYMQTLMDHIHTVSI
jgi:uncharacterized protein (DUF1697 family)